MISWKVHGLGNASELHAPQLLPSLQQVDVVAHLAEEKGWIQSIPLYTLHQEVMEHTVSEHHRPHSLKTAVIPFLQASPSSFQSAKCIFNHNPCSACLVVEHLLMLCEEAGVGKRLHEPACQWIGSISNDVVTNILSIYALVLL